MLVCASGGDAVFDSKQKIKNFRDPSNGERVRREVTVERGVRIKIITIVFLILRDILAVIPNTTETSAFQKSRRSSSECNTARGLQQSFYYR